MIDEAHARAPVVTTLDLACEWFDRGLAVVCLGLGLFYWIRLIGIYDGVLWRFDLMPAHWQVACVVLAVLFPIAGIGLWMTVSWGPVLWFVAATSESAMYGLMPDLFGSRPAIVAFHLVTLVAFLGLRGALFHRKWRAERSG